jgi:hypothetical protein
MYVVQSTSHPRELAGKCRLGDRRNRGDVDVPIPSGVSSHFDLPGCMRPPSTISTCTRGEARSATKPTPISMRPCSANCWLLAWSMCAVTVSVRLDCAQVSFVTEAAEDLLVELAGDPGEGLGTGDLGGAGGGGGGGGGEEGVRRRAGGVAWRCRAVREVDQASGKGETKPRPLNLAVGTDHCRRRRGCCCCCPPADATRRSSGNSHRRCRKDREGLTGPIMASTCSWSPCAPSLLWGVCRRSPATAHGPPRPAGRGPALVSGGCQGTAATTHHCPLSQQQ